MDDTSDIGTFHLPLKRVHAQPASEIIKLPSKPDLAAHEDGQQSTLESNIIGTKSTPFPRVQMAAIIGCVTYSTAITTFLSGVVIIAIPSITLDLHLASNLILWPVSIYSLTCGCTLLLCGSISDVVGNRQTYLLGCFLQSAFALACGLSKNGSQIIVFRAFSGIAASFCLPSAVSLINEVFSPGKSRNIAFSSMGAAQPIGFGLGLTLGGIFTGTIGWQWGFYAAAITNLIMFVLAAWQLPRNAQKVSNDVWDRLKYDIDWIGAILATTFLAMLSYVLAAITGKSSDIRHPTCITLLILSFMFLLAFILWVGRQENLGRPALIPNSLWRHKVFSCICINVFCIWAAFNAFEQYLNFFFQNVQQIRPLGAAIRFLPAPVSGALTNIVVGLIVHSVRGDRIVIMTSIATAVGSALMAIASPSWSYWACAFLANFLNPIGADGIFTVSNLLITSMFPAKTQGVAGGVFNTMAQTGKNVGLTLTTLAANQATTRALQAGKLDPDALLVGYRVAFWFCSALAIASICVSIWGLRKIGKVGRKMD